MPISSPKKLQHHEYHILIIEDDEYIADVYRTKFEKEGFMVTVAKDGDQGVEQALSLKPSIVLLDLILPKQDGFSVLKKIKEHKTTRAIPVMVWTNKSESEDSTRARKLGATDYLVKVYHMPSEVVEKVKNRLNIT